MVWLVGCTKRGELVMGEAQVAGGKSYLVQSVGTHFNVRTCFVRIPSLAIVAQPELGL